jgi:endoglucanase
MVSWSPDAAPKRADTKALDFLAKHGFDFVRLPTDYRFWVPDFDYLHADDSMCEHIDGYLAETQKRGQHLSLNLHRAPGYCINRNDLERDNLWLDEVAQDGFVHMWEMFARRYQGVSNEDMSFDLVNEPPDVGQYGMTREVHAKVIRRVVAAIRAVDPGRQIVIDGLAGGHLAMPELADLGVIHSGRGYQPMTVSHYQASWWAPALKFDPPEYPGGDWDGHAWNREALVEFYEPWREVERLGANVHIGEFGCYEKTPNDVALRWLTDLFGVFKEFGWGYGLWNFEGAFGIIGHSRPGTRWEEIDGYRVDRDLLELMINGRVS